MKRLNCSVFQLFYVPTWSDHLKFVNSITDLASLPYLDWDFPTLLKCAYRSFYITLTYRIQTNDQILFNCLRAKLTGITRKTEREEVRSANIFASLLSGRNICYDVCDFQICHEERNCFQNYSGMSQPYVATFYYFETKLIEQLVVQWTT